MKFCRSMSAAWCAGALLLTGGFALTGVPAGATAPPAGKRDGQKSAVVRFALTLSRTDLPAGANPASALVTLAAPMLTTLDGNTASVSVAGGDPSYTISLSPTVETADNKVQVLWTIRLAGKTLPGASSVTLTGASRVGAGKDAILAEITLTDGATGKRAVYRLQGVVTTESAPAPEAQPAKLGNTKAEIIVAGAKAP